MRSMKGEGQVSNYERKVFKDAAKSTKRGEGQVSDMDRKTKRG